MRFTTGRLFGADVALMLGFDPNDVYEIRIEVPRIVVYTYWRNKAGKFEVNAAGTRAKRVIHVLNVVTA